MTNRNRALTVLLASIEDHDGIKMKFQKGHAVSGLYPGNKPATILITRMAMEGLSVTNQVLELDWNEGIGTDKMTIREKELLIQRLKEITARISNSI